MLQSKGIVVRRASTAQLLGMKLSAWRSITDQKDSRDLLQALQSETNTHQLDEIWEMVQLYVTEGKTIEALENLQDIWDDLSHGGID